MPKSTQSQHRPQLRYTTIDHQWISIIFYLWKINHKSLGLESSFYSRKYPPPPARISHNVVCTDETAEKKTRICDIAGEFKHCEIHKEGRLNAKHAG